VGTLRDTMQDELKAAEEQLRAQLGTAEAPETAAAAPGQEATPQEPPPTEPAAAPEAIDPEKSEGLVAPDEAREADPSYWKHRAETIRGQLTAANRRHADELGAAREELALLKQALAQQSQLIEMLKARGGPTAEPGEPEAREPRRAPAPGRVKPKDITRQQLIDEEGYTEQEIEDYGEEWLKGEAARRRNLAAALESRVSEHVQKLSAQQSQESEAARRWDEIERICPGAKKAEAEAGRNGLAEWLSEPVLSSDGLPTGVTRRQLAQQAFGEGRVDVVAKVFGAFLGTRKAGAASPSAQSQVSPKGRPEPMTAAAQGPARPKVWSLADIEQFTEDCLRGKYKPEVRAAMQRDIDNAAREGRITP